MKARAHLSAADSGSVPSWSLPSGRPIYRRRRVKFTCPIRNYRQRQSACFADDRSRKAGVPEGDLRTAPPTLQRLAVWVVGRTKGAEPSPIRAKADQ